MQFGFAIDQRKCIGCHACTVACKAENDVPVGSFRTWVQYTEKGRFPEVRRHFTVLRCNHCDAAPCVTICPVGALDKRPDAIVDLDRDTCIGCRACMQACPYDALYFAEDKGVAEKCHYCAHRVEVGLAPACVVVCPEEAIVSGDTSDPESPISRLIASQPTTRRRLDKETDPRVWYVDALDEALEPGRAAEPESYLFSDRASFDAPAPVVPGFEPTPDVIRTLDAPHAPAWGWHVWVYLVTKNLAAGAMLLAPFLALMGLEAGAARDLVPEIVALVFLAVTGALLTHDLGRPERVWRLFLAPNTRSWLVRGAWVISAFGAATGGALLARLFGADGFADVLRWIALPLAALTSGYTAWLFAQCKGRDLWLEKGLFVRLVLRAGVLGAGLALALAPWSAEAGTFFAIAAVMCGLVFIDERREGPKEHLAGHANALLWRGPARHSAWMHFVAAGLGLTTPFLAVLVPETPGLALLGAGLAFALVIASQLVYEREYIRAGQAVPIS